MRKIAVVLATLGLAFAGTVFADGATGMPSGKRQHKPVSTSEPQPEPRTEGTRVRKTMQDLKSNAQEPEPAMNKKEMAEKLAKKADVSETRMNKAELTETLASDAGLSKADAKREAGKQTPEALRNKDKDVEKKTNKSEAARSKRK